MFWCIWAPYNNVWGNNYRTNLDKLYLVQKQLIKIITCSQYRSHTEPLCIGNRILNMIQSISFQINGNIHDYDVCSVDDIHVPYGRLDMRRFCIRITGVNVWNTLPEYIKSTSSIHLSQRGLKNHLLDRSLVLIWSCMAQHFVIYDYCTCDNVM